MAVFEGNIAPMTADPTEPIRQAFANAEPVEDPAAPAPPDGADAGLPPSPPVGDVDEPPEARGARLPLNDLGNAQRLILYYGEDMMFVPRVGWFLWTGQLWEKDPDDVAVRRLAHKVSERIEDEIPHLSLADWEQRLVDWKAATLARRNELHQKPAKELTEDDGKEAAQLDDRLERIAQVEARRKGLRQAHHRHAKSAGNSGPVSNMLLEARVTLARPAEDLDAAPLDINTASGVLRFTAERAGEDSSDIVVTRSLLPHARHRLLTKIVPVQLDDGATCPRFDAFLARVQPDPEVRGFLQRWFGLSLTALTVQRLAFLYGAGANGKSVLVDLMARIAGGYAATAKIESLTGQSRRGGGDATPDLVPLMGARMVRASEPEEGERLKEGIIKELTGGEPILIRGLHQDFIQVKPHFKLTISGNHKPDIRGTDDGIWRRLMLVDFPVQIPEAERDQELGDKLWEERAGILNWMLAGLVDYLEQGLSPPRAVQDATAEYRAESDPVGVFLGDWYEVTAEPGIFTFTKDVVSAFTVWTRARGETPWQPTTTSRRLSEKAGRWRDPRSGLVFAKGKRNGIAGYTGLRLTDIGRDQYAKAAGELPGPDSRDRGVADDPF